MFDRDEQEISQIVESGIEAILSGRATLEQVLAQHPVQAEEIRGELEGALWLASRQAEVAARPGYVMASRRRVIERIQAEADSQGTRRAFFGFAWPQRFAFQWIVAVVVVMALLTGTGSVLTVSESSLPGEDLYAVKRAAEQVTYTVTVNNVERVALSAQYTDRRLDEAKALIVKGDYPTAETTLKDYEQGIQQTLNLLEQVSDKPSNKAEEVAVHVKQNFADNVHEINAITEHIPMDTHTKARLRRAVTASIDGSEMAGSLYLKIKEDAQPPSTAATPTPFSPASATPVSNTATPANTSRPTSTRVPPTLEPTSGPRRPTATAAPTSTPEPTLGPSETPLPTLLPTDTPEPTASPTDNPSILPTGLPTGLPTDAPTAVPTETAMPTSIPASLLPTDIPTATAPPPPLSGSLPATPTDQQFTPTPPYP